MRIKINLLTWWHHGIYARLIFNFYSNNLSIIFISFACIAFSIIELKSPFSYLSIVFAKTQTKGNKMWNNTNYRTTYILTSSLHFFLFTMIDLYSYVFDSDRGWNQSNLWTIILLEVHICHYTKWLWNTNDHKMNAGQMD